MQNWQDQLLAAMDNGTTRMDWLREGAASRKPKGLADHVAKVMYLKELGADRLELDLPTALLKDLARPMLYRKPATLRRMRGERRLLEMACFLRWQLLHHSDDGIDMIDFRIADLWRQARGRVELKGEVELRRHRHLVASMVVLTDDENTPPEGLRTQMRALLVPFVDASGAAITTQVAQIRSELSNDALKANELLRATEAIGIDLAPMHPLSIALKTLKDAESAGTRCLPLGAANPFGSTWRWMIDQSDRAAALNGYRAATLMLLKRSLRNGQASVSHSLEHRAPEERLIPMHKWNAERGRFMREIGIAAKPEVMLRGLKADLSRALQTLDTAIRNGDVRIKDDRFVVPKLQAVEEELVVRATRRALYARIGPIELPELLIEVDASTRFSWELLGRPPRSESELITLYAAVISLGSDMSAAELARMTRGIGADAIGEMMMRIEASGRLRATNLLVLDHFRALPIAAIWGEGLNASADMMSLDATGYHWSARHDPRRLTPAIGTYTHILDQWPILHNMPIILNRRQAGPAIEGALRHEAIELKRLAVDTHGFTHFAMALAKLVGFDLCPQLAHLSDRKLYLPRGLVVPEILRPLVRETVPTRAISKGWDQLLRIAASTKTGWCSATYILDRFGSAAHGDVAFQAGDALGKLMRTRYLADYLGDIEFRTMIHTLLNQGEAVHTLQRAIHHGPIGARRGRTLEQMTAISSCLTLLTNIVMTWNAMRMDAARSASPTAFADAHLKRIAPIPHGHINMRGQLTFDIAPHRERLLDDASATGQVWSRAV